MRNIHQKQIFRKVRNLCNKNNLIFDECTTGYRENMGGIHLNYKVYPDLAIFEKALGNGFAINAIIGRKKIMQNAEKTFISSTCWGERVGYTAAISSINEFKRLKAFNKVINNGRSIKRIWAKLSKK